MPVIFTDEMKLQIRKQLLCDGRAMLLERGITGMNLGVLAKKAGIAKGTFYNFFPSKQEFVLEIIQDYQHEKIEELKEMAAGKQKKLTLDEAAVWYKSLYLEQENPLFKVHSKDMQWLLERIPVEVLFRPELDIQTAKIILSMVDGVRKDIDYGVLANFPKMVSFALEHREFMHQEALPKNFELLIDCMFRYVKGDVN